MKSSNVNFQLNFFSFLRRVVGAISVVFIFIISANAYALGRTHQYNIYVVDKYGQPVSDVSVSTNTVRGYDQSSLSCITSSDGLCVLSFSAFAPSSTSVSVILISNSKSDIKSGPISLPNIKSSLFKSIDSIDVKLTYDEEAFAAEGLTDAEKYMADKQVEAEKALVQLKSLEELDRLEKDAVQTCLNRKSCEKVYALTEIFFSKESDMKIQTTTGTTLETYNPIRPGAIGFRAIKTPGKGSSASIKLTVLCKEAYVNNKGICIELKKDAYRKYKKFMVNALAD